MATMIDRPKTSIPPKGQALFERFREIISDPLNLLIERVPMAGVVANGRITLHNGLIVPVNTYYGEFSSILAVNRGVHEPLEEFVFQEMLRQLDPAKPIEMIELGAYWAHYSMWLKSRFPDARTTCVEPELENLESGQRNFSLNGLSGTFIQDFVSNEHFQVDRFLAAEPKREIDVLHADIQGYELQMLSGAATALAERRIRRLFVSTHSQDLHDGVIDFLKDAGYRIDISSDFTHETTSFDGFVYASLPEFPALLPGVDLIGRAAICEARPHELVAYLNSILEGRTSIDGV